MKEKPIIQRFDRTAAQSIVDSFKIGWGKVKRAVIGLPIFRGHPDASRYSQQFPDKTPRGTIADMEVTDKGLRIQPVLTEQGLADVLSGWDEFSPFWMCNGIGEENGVRIVRPYLLKSIGIVPKGNIPGLSLVNYTPSSRGNLVLDQVNERMKTHGDDYETAFAIVQGDPRNAGLFASMRKPISARR